MQTIAVIAPGAMGSAVARRLTENGVRVLTSLTGRSATTRDRAEASGMTHAEDSEIVAADLILSIVPPADAAALAIRFAPTLATAAKKPVYVDMNAVSPATVHGIAATIAPTGAPFLDGAILGLPPRPGTKGPRIYAAGADLAPVLALRECGLDMRTCEGDVGAASGLKMAYAGINKGLRALAAVVVLGAERTGAAAALRAELAESEPELLAKLAAGFPDMIPKAHRWVAEMHEIADFLASDRAGDQIFAGAAEMFARLAAPDGEADVATLLAFAADAGGSSRTR